VIDMNKFSLKYKPYGEKAILIEWAQEISVKILEDIREFASKIEYKKINEIVELNFVYNSLLIQYDSSRINFDLLKTMLNSIYCEDSNEIKTNSVLWEIPVCYHTDFGIDLEEISLKNNIGIGEIISLHCNSIYTVYGIGFLPGFLYLGGLPEILHFPRKKTPRLTVPKGAVGIANSQTGIYPQQSPGGWQIIGRTPISLFDVSKEFPSQIKASDRIQFNSISKKEFSVIKELDRLGNYKLKEIILND